MNQTTHIICDLSQFPVLLEPSTMKKTRLVNFAPSLNISKKVVRCLVNVVQMGKLHGEEEVILM